jgi:hypothetical protein
LAHDQHAISSRLTPKVLRRLPLITAQMATRCIAADTSAGSCRLNAPNSGPSAGFL